MYYFSDSKFINISVLLDFPRLYHKSSSESEVVWFSMILQENFQKKNFFVKNSLYLLTSYTCHILCEANLQSASKSIVTILFMPSFKSLSYHLALKNCTYLWKNPYTY